MCLSNDPSVFDIINLFHLHWFLNRDWLLSFITSAQRSESGRIKWVEFLPDGHVHLVRSAFKLIPPTPSIPTAKIKWYMFAFIIEFLNRERLYADLFAPSPPRKVCKRTRKPRDTGPQRPAGGQAIDAMALDAENQDPALEAPPSLMEPSFATVASPPPSFPLSPSAVQPALRTYMEPAGRSVGLFWTPTPLAGQKHTLTPSPPTLPPTSLPTSPPPPINTHLMDAPADWRNWIKARQDKGKAMRVRLEDIEAAAQALAPPFFPPL